MKLLLIFVFLVAAIYSFVIPVKILTAGVVREAPDVLYQLDGVPGTSFWVTNVTVGTPGQTFTLALDTWSYALWIPSIYCNSNSSAATAGAPPCYGKNLYNPAASSTFEEGFSYSSQGHLGAVYGTYGRDVVYLGSIANQSTISMPQWIQASSISGVVANTPGIDGVLGLAGNSGQAFPDQVFNEPNMWNKNVITLWLENQWETSDNGTEGAIYYGNYDPLHCNFSYSVPNTKPTIYQFTTTRFQMSLNGKSVVDSQNNRQTILDTTSPYISVPRALATQVLLAFGLDAASAIPAAVPCSTAGTFNFTLTTAKGKEIIQSINLILPKTDGSCILAMNIAQTFATDPSAGHIELGIPFYRGRCTYLDRTQQTIGFGFPGHRVPQPSTPATPEKEFVSNILL